MLSKLSDINTWATVFGIASVAVILYGFSGGFAPEDMTGKKKVLTPAVQAVPVK